MYKSKKMKQIKKLIFNIVIMILFVTMLFFAWQKLAKTKFLIRKEAGSLQELKNSIEINKTYNSKQHRYFIRFLLYAKKTFKLKI